MNTVTLPLVGREGLFWLITTGVFFYAVSYLSPILLPFVLGLSIAYFLDPLADRLQSLGLSRLWAALIILFLFTLIVILGLVMVVPLLFEQAVSFAAKLPTYAKWLEEVINTNGKLWLGKSFTELEIGSGKILQDFGPELTKWAARVLGSALSGGLAIINFLSLILITPVVAFYLLKDWDQMIARADQMLPRAHAPTIRRLIGDMDKMIDSFVRGQLTVIFLLSVFYAVSLQLAGLNFGLLIGIGAGIISFIPFVGALTGFIVAGTVALVQFGSDWVPIAIVLGIFIAGQLIEGNFLTPIILGDRIKLHPVWLIFALFVFGYMFNFVGLLIAVPLAAAIGVLVRFALEKYHESEIYQGDEEATAAPSKKSQDAGRQQKK